MEQTFNERIRAIGREATEFIYQSLKDTEGIIFGEDDPKIAGITPKEFGR